MFALVPVYGLRGGFEPAASVLLMSVFAARAILIQPLIGWLADRIDRCLHRGGFPIPARSCGRTAAIRYRHHPLCPKSASASVAPRESQDLNRRIRLSPTLEDGYRS